MHRRPRSPLPDWNHTVSFELVDSERNRYRSYHLTLTTDLFGNWVLIRSWGRIGKPRREQRDYFPFRFDAQDHAQQIIRRRLLHGYRVVDTR